MLFARLADLVVVVHAMFVAFVVLGGFLVLRRPRLAWLHIPVAVWGVLIEFAGWICPLTPLENMLRARGGQAGYEGGFVDHYIIPVLYPQALNRNIQYALGFFVLVVNAVAYMRFFRRRGRMRPAHGDAS